MDVALYLITPNIPSVRLLPCKQFDPGQVAHKLHDTLSGFVGLLAMALHMAHNDLVHTGGHPLGVSFRCQDAYFRIGASPITHAPEQTIADAVLLHPYNGDGLILKTPGFQHFKGFLHTGESDPHKQCTILSCQLLNW